MNYRDPRDVILSAMDHGKRSRELGLQSGGFVEFQSVIDSIPFVQSMIEKFEHWSHFHQVYLVRYETLVTNPIAELSQVAKFLNWKVAKKDLEVIVNEQLSKRKDALNFNKGTTERWKTEMNAKEVHLTTQAFKPFLKKMRYEV